MIVMNLTDSEEVYDFFGNLKNADFGAQKGGFNVLNVNDAYYEPGVFFEKYNKPWLEEAIARGDEFYAVSDPTKGMFIYKRIDDILQDGTNGTTIKLTGYGKEVEILYKNGYKYNPSTRKFVK